MSWWKKLFGKSGETLSPSRPAAPRLQAYRDKYARFLELLDLRRALQERLAKLTEAVTAPPAAAGENLTQLGRETLQLLEQAKAALDGFCRQAPSGLDLIYGEVTARLQEIVAAAASPAAPAAARLQEDWRRLLSPGDRPGGESDAEPAAPTLPALLEAMAAAHLGEMFCLSLRARVSKKEAASLVTGRLVPILVVDVDGGLSRAAATVGLEDIASVPFRAFLTGMLSIPWPKARPVDMKGFISVVGVTSTTPRSEDQLKKISLAILARDYMNFSLCLGYHASTIEAYVAGVAASNYLRFHYQGGAASVERRVRRLRLISGILTRLGFEVSICGDLLDGRKQGDDLPAGLKLLEILGRLEVFTKQMDMVMSSDEVIYGYIEDFLTNHC